MKQHWLYRVENRGKIWKASAVVLGLTLAAEFFIHIHAYFPGTGLFGFHALYGFMTCIGMVVFAKVLGYLIKRRDDYYDL